MALKMIVKNTFFLFLLLPFHGVLAQDFDTVFKKSLAATTENKTFEVGTQYKIFRGNEGTKALEEYTGVLSKNEGKVYQKLGNMELLQTDTYFVKLNHDDQEIIVLNSSENQQHLPTVDIHKTLEHFEKGDIKDKGDYYQLEFIGKPNNRLRIEKLHIDIYKNSYLIKKQVIYFSYLTDFSVYQTKSLKKDFDSPRLEVVFTDYNNEVDLSNFKQERYFSVANNTVILGREFKDFEIISTK